MFHQSKSMDDLSTTSAVWEWSF